MTYQGPYRVMYYVHDIFSNQEDYYRQRYCQIMLKEEAEMKAKGLLNSMMAYYKKVNPNYMSLAISTCVLNAQNQIVKEFKKCQ